VFSYKRDRKLAKWVLITPLLLLGVAIGIGLLKALIPGGSRMDPFSNPWGFILVSALIAAILYELIERLTESILSKTLFKEQDQHDREISEVMQLFLSVQDLKELSNLIVNTVTDHYRLKVVLLGLFDEAKQRFWIVSSRGMPLAVSQKIQLEVDSILIQKLKAADLGLTRNEILTRVSSAEREVLSHDFEDLLVTDIGGIRWEGELIGFLGFTSWEDQKPVVLENSQSLQCLLEASGLALKNALAYEDLRRANDQLKHFQSKLLQSSKLAAVGDLAQGLAHEIHNPLAIISGKAQLLLFKKPEQFTETEVKDVLKTIVKQTERAADITRKLLVFSEPSSSNKEDIAFGQLIEDTLALVSYQATLDEIAIVKKIPDELPPFRGDVHEIREVLLNLILNAVQAVGNRGTIRIHIRTIDREGLIEIRIEDTGKGIKTEDLSRLFNPFFTTRETGVGLGLFISQQIVNRYHGSIHIESEFGSGTLVIVQLPYDKKTDHNPDEQGRFSQLGKEKLP